MLRQQAEASVLVLTFARIGSSLANEGATTKAPMSYTRAAAAADRTCHWPLTCHYRLEWGLTCGP